MSISDISIIFVPGIRPKPPVADHQEQLRRCLSAGVCRAGGSKEEASAIAAVFRVVGWSFDFYGEHGDLQMDLPGIERLLAGNDRPEDDVREATALKRHIAGWLYAMWDRLPLFAELFATPRMETRLREVRRYFRNRNGAGVAIRRRVATELQESWDNGNSVLLIGHSFGSVIAYDTLWELTHEQHNKNIVDCFVTMGSPLTLKYMRTRLKGARKRGAKCYPNNIVEWVNLAAIGEVTALDRKLGSCFEKMLTSGVTRSITDNLELVNQFHGPLGLNAHKCYGYLASEAAGCLLLDWYRRHKP